MITRLLTIRKWWTEHHTRVTEINCTRDKHSTAINIEDEKNGEDFFTNTTIQNNYYESLCGSLDEGSGYATKLGLAD